MKPFLIIPLITLLSCATFAQTMLKDIEFAEEGTIYLTEKDSIEGVLAFTYIKSNQVVMVGQKETKYKPEDIKGFYMKTSKTHFVSGTGGLGSKLFLQVEVPGKKAKVVKTFTPAGGVKIEEDKPVEGTWLSSLYLTDKGVNFENSKKIAEAIKAECPTLASKLTTKNSGYFINLFTTPEEMLDIYGKIIQELDAGCQ